MRDRYEHIATRQQRINEANKTLELLTYKNKCEMSLKKFSSKLQLAVDTLIDCDRLPHNRDILDMIWEKIQNTGL